LCRNLGGQASKREEFLKPDRLFGQPRIAEPNGSFHANNIGDVATVTNMVVRNSAAMHVEKVRNIGLVIAHLLAWGPLRPMAVA